MPGGAGAGGAAAVAAVRARGAVWWLGPAFVVSVAYVDPGNFAANMAGGAAFGYRLLWVLLAGNGVAVLVQYLAAKLGIATGASLPANCRRHFPAWTCLLWGAAQASAVATDLAEVLGGALAFHLLFGLPLWLGAVLTAGAVFLVLALERAGFRWLEAGIGLFVGLIGAAYVCELLLVPVDWRAAAAGLVRPSLDRESAYVAAAMLGATVMPHVVYLHSALVLPRRAEAGAGRAREHARGELADLLLAMNGAWLVNSAMIVLAAATFFAAGRSVQSLEEAYRTLTPLVGPGAAAVFGLALLASGLASAAVGTLAGQVIMAGFLQVRLSPFLLRSLTLLPALAVIAAGLDPSRILVLSQVVLGFTLPAALIPLLLLTSRPALMGPLVNGRAVRLLAWAAVGAVLGLDAYLLLC